MTAPAIAPAEDFLDVVAEPELPPPVLLPMPLLPLSSPPLALGIGVAEEVAVLEKEPVGLGPAPVDSGATEQG